MNNNYYLGIDGGGTSSVALVCDSSLNKIISVKGESINFYSEGLERSRNNMKNILAEIEEKSGIKHFDSVFIGMSALSGRATKKQQAEFCDGIFCADKITMDSDIYIALYAANVCPASVVIAGTGSMAAAVTANKKIITAGGAGYLLGDEGSAWSIADAAIRYAVRALYGAEKKTALTKEMLMYFDAQNADSLIDIFYNKKISRSKEAGFADCVDKCALCGDSAAQKIIEDQAKLLSKTLSALLKKMPEATPVFVWGGVFANSKLFFNSFLQCSKGFAPNIKMLPNSPVVGAAIAARDFFVSKTEL